MTIFNFTSCAVVHRCRSFRESGCHYDLATCLVTRVPTDQGKLEKVGEFVWSGKGQGKILFLKSQGNWSWIMQTADICDFFRAVKVLTFLTH